MLARSVLLAFLTLFVFIGCSSDHMDTPATPSTSQLEISPSDGAVDVRLDAPITVRFASGIDRAVVEQELHLISELDMMSGICPDSSMATHGSMMEVMADSMMMRHLDDFHATGIDFQWNAAGTECTVQPDSMLEPGTRYMVHMGSGMTRMMESRMGGMGDMGGMGGHGTGSMGDDMMFHFATMDTSDGGHLGHH
ncbi:MAG: Ig-like domain-containing protein [bacterium]|nr:Ig-like domain-containing protein [bacterium]